MIRRPMQDPRRWHCPRCKGRGWIVMTCFRTIYYRVTCTYCRGIHP